MAEIVHGVVMRHILESFLQELERAEAKHPAYPPDPIHAAAILAEEAGEVVKAALQFTYEGGTLVDMEKEAIQTGAMAIRFLKNLHRFH